MSTEGPKVLWVLGEPGVGKTTLVRELTKGTLFSFVENPKWTFAGEGFALAGHYKGGTFDGADTVPYNGADAALIYWEQNLRGKYPVTILDGDRFSHDGARRFFSPLASTFAVLLTAPSEVVSARRQERGSNQSASWVAGRKTKSARFFEGFDNSHALQIDASLPVEQIVERVRDLLQNGSGRDNSDGLLSWLGS
jgi:hypothetical protein